MTEGSLKFLSGQEPSLFDLWGWYEFQRALIGEEKGRVLDALNAALGPATNRYAGKTPAELKDDFAYQQSELDQLMMLGLLTATKASLRVDFVLRVRYRKKDALSREFRNADKATKHRIEKIRLEADILDAWRKHGGSARRKNAIGQFKGVLKLRHWLAHGRYWRPKLGRALGFDPVQVFDICKELLQSLEILPDDITE
jgi:hypothetical protein